MELVLYGFILAASAGALYVSGEWVVNGLMRLSRALGVREFVVAFFVMAAAASLPNLFVGVTAALEGIPELSLGDVFGNNLIAMTVAVAAGVFFARGSFISAAGQTIRTSLLFTVAAAVLPVVLVADGLLSRVDALLLVALFFLYVRWLFAQEDRFSRAYNHGEHERPLARLRHGFHSFIKVGAGVALLLLAALGIVASASFFAAHFDIPLILVGLLVVGVGNALPEVYFSLISARRGDTALIMGNVMGSVIVPSTLILGVVGLIHPIAVSGFEFLAGSRAFLLAAALLFFIVATTRHRITRPEAALLVLLYAAFVLWVVFGNHS
jgi:cation:H+ antiporter